MNLTPEFRRLAVRPFPSSPWVYDLVERVKASLIKVFEGIYESQPGGSINYDKIPTLREGRAFYGMDIPSGPAEGSHLSIYLRPSPGDLITAGKIIPVPRPGVPGAYDLKVVISFGAPEDVEEIHVFLYDDHYLAEVLKTLHHELIHAEDIKIWNRLWDKSGGYTSYKEDLTRYYQQPTEVSAREGSAYFYFQRSAELRVPLREAIDEYLNHNSKMSRYTELTKKNPRLWRNFLTRVYRSADQAYTDFKRARAPKKIHP